MTKKERENLQGKLEWEGGFEYFIGGSSFEEIKDKKFHALREAFVKSHSELEAYIYNE